MGRRITFGSAMASISLFKRWNRMARIDAFFKLMSEQKASDLHLSTNNPPMLRINGDLVRVDYPALKDEELKTMADEIAPETKIKLYEENLELDFGNQSP